MARVTGIGGVFFKVKDPAATLAWYREHLGIEGHEWGFPFRWRTSQGDASKGYTVWAPFKEDTTYFDPSEDPFMINFRVEEIEALIDKLRNGGVKVVGGIDQEPNGKFAWILDFDGRKIELWEPIDPDQDPYMPD